MYACVQNPGADFSRGCAGQRIGPLLFATHPHRYSGIDFRRYALAAYRSGFMQNRGYDLPSMHLPGRLVKALIPLSAVSACPARV